MKLTILSFLLAFSMPFTTQWTTDFEKAKTDATASKKLILLSFSGSDWCMPCIKMKKEIFDAPDFVNIAAQKLVLLKADFPRSKKNKLSAQQTKHNESLADKYNPQGVFPLTLLLDAKGKVLKTWNGVPKISAFVNDIKSVNNGSN
jgi:thioredoxin-related protein